MASQVYNYLVWDGSMRVRLDAEPHRKVISLPWNLGKPLEAVPAITASVSSKELPDHLVIGSINYVSGRLLQLLEAAGVRAQYFPVRSVRAADGTEVASPKLFAVNFLCVVECFDFSRSEFTRRPEHLGGGIERIARLEIMESSLVNEPVAVMDELGEILIRRDLVESLRQHRIRGCRWREIETVRLPQTEWPVES